MTQVNIKTKYGMFRTAWELLQTSPEFKNKSRYWCKALDKENNGKPGIDENGFVTYFPKDLSVQNPLDITIDLPVGRYKISGGDYNLKQPDSGYPCTINVWVAVKEDGATICKRMNELPTYEACLGPKPAETISFYADEPAVKAPHTIAKSPYPQPTDIPDDYAPQTAEHQCNGACKQKFVALDDATFCVKLNCVVTENCPTCTMFMADYDKGCDTNCMCCTESVPVYRQELPTDNNQQGKD